MIKIKKIIATTIIVISLCLGITAILLKSNNVIKNISNPRIEKMRENKEEIIKEIKVAEINNWKANITLPKYDRNGKIIKYTIDEKEVPKGYKKTVKDTTVINTLIEDIKASLIINHIDKTTGEIIETEEKTGQENEKIKTKAKDIPLYNLVEKPEIEEYILTKESQTVNYYYEKTLSGIIEKHINSITNELLEDPIEHKGEEGESYKINPKEFKDYKLDENKIPQNAQGTFKNEPQEINYYYIPKAGKITINYIDQTTKQKITKSNTIEGWIGEKYETIPKQFKEYDIIEKLPENRSGTMKKEEITVNYYYKYKSKIIIDYIDKETNNIIKQEIKSGYEGDIVETNELEIPYYKLEEKPEIEKYTLKKEPLKIVYKYRKLKFNIKIEHIIEKVIVNEKEYQVNSPIHKIEMPKKQKENNIKIYYKIKITNDGEVNGNTEIHNYIPEGYQALKINNPDWNIGNRESIMYIDNLQIGETKEYTLIVNNISKTETGKITNKATAENSTNKAEYKEMTLEDNNSQTEFVITISTGLENNIKEILYIVLPITILISIILNIIIYRRKHSLNTK